MWIIKLVCAALSATSLAWGIENSEQVAFQARALLVDDTTFFVGSLATTKNDSAVVAHEYFAPCFTSANNHSAANPGDLLFIALPISEQWRLSLQQNKEVSFAVASSANMEVVDPRHGQYSPAGRLQWTPDRPMWRRGMASKNRLIMKGHMHLLEDTAANESLSKCFLTHHPDAAAWQPGSIESPHTAKWARYAPNSIHYVGGFGDEHFIGDVDMELYKSVELRLNVPTTVSHGHHDLYMQNV